jgi:hypothetical protein
MSSRPARAVFNGLSISPGNLRRLLDRDETFCSPENHPNLFKESSMFVRSCWVGVMALVPLVALGALTGCAGGAPSMTPQQKEAFELRRFCERNPDDIARCLGFLGDH